MGPEIELPSNDLHNLLNDDHNDDAHDVLKNQSCKYFEPEEVYKQFDSDHFSIFSHNIRSLSGHFDSLKDSLYSMLPASFSVIALQEVWSIHKNYDLTGYSHFTFWASPQHILLHFPIHLLHFPIKFASFPQKNASFPQQFAAFPQQNASFPQQFAAFPYAMLCHFANIRKPDFIQYSHFFLYFWHLILFEFSGDSGIQTYKSNVQLNQGRPM